MYEAHKHVNNGQFPTEEQYDIVLEHFVGTLQELGVKEDVTMLEF